MAIADLAAYKIEVGGTKECVNVPLPTGTVVAGFPYDGFRLIPPAPAIPTSAVVPGNTTSSINQQDGTTGTLGLVAARFSMKYPGTYVICDRLSHQGGLSGTTTGAQTTNLPTAALTRYTSGVGVMCGLTIYSAVGSTATTATVSYTNTAGTSGRTSPLVVFGGTNYNAAARIVLIPCASGENGFQAVASVTLAASTLTAGNFGVTLFKPLVMIVVDDTGGTTHCDFVSGHWVGGLPEVVDNGCLFVMGFSSNTELMGSAALQLSEW